MSTIKKCKKKKIRKNAKIEFTGKSPKCQSRKNKNNNKKHEREHEINEKGLMNKIIDKWLLKFYSGFGWWISKGKYSSLVQKYNNK